MMILRYTFLLFFISCANNFKLNAQTQAKMNQTAITSYKKADTELNKVYQKVLKILSESEKTLFIKAQKDWLKFRDSHCNFEIEQYKGGSIQPLIFYNCLEEKTRQRINDLNSILKEESR